MGRRIAGRQSKEAGAIPKEPASAARLTSPGSSHRQETPMSPIAAQPAPCADWLAVRVKLDGLRERLRQQPAQRHEQVFVFRGQTFRLEYLADADTGILRSIRSHRGSVERRAGRLACRVSAAPSPVPWPLRIRQIVANLFAPLLDMWDGDKQWTFGCPMLESRAQTMLRYLTPHVPLERLRSVNVDVDRIFAA
ncbi:hypothetical protein N6G02_19620 [Cupriavidus gilardii]|uniref:hypothetical protein n=2 Tax=Cupriavidus gilardii TaxID=82541 RepID=UPI0021BF5132|nr:hypothetical protein [Cupriavidus gilardii]MCT9118357.1 hypothetical protein [Cupriavidus gilardii]